MGTEVSLAVHFVFLCLLICLFIFFSFCLIISCFVLFCCVSFFSGVNAAKTKLDVSKKCHISLHGDGLDMSFVCLAVTASVSKSTDPDLITSLLPLHHSYLYSTLTFSSLLPLHHSYLYITRTFAAPLHLPYSVCTDVFPAVCLFAPLLICLFTCFDFFFFFFFFCFMISFVWFRLALFCFVLFSVYTSQRRNFYYVQKAPHLSLVTVWSCPL